MNARRRQRSAVALLARSRTGSPRWRDNPLLSSELCANFDLLIDINHLHDRHETAPMGRARGALVRNAQALAADRFARRRC
jgi:hypothetical protein